MIKRGEIYFVDLNPAHGREQSGMRPVLVLSIDSINKLPLVITVIAGTKGTNITKDFSTNVRIPATESGLEMETVFMCFQIRALDPKRFPANPAGIISKNYLRKIEDAARHCLGL